MFKFSHTVHLFLWKIPSARPTIAQKQGLSVMNNPCKFMKVDAPENLLDNYTIFMHLTFLFLECGGRITAANGVITSPEYPMMYPSNQHCIWLLSMADDSLVRLTFDYFDLEDNLNCAYDYLLIRDGADADSPVIGRFCGPSTHIPEEFLQSSSKDLRIEFRSDATGSKGGFRLSWNTMLKRTTEPALVTTPTTFGRHKIITGKYKDKASIDLQTQYKR